MRDPTYAYFAIAWVAACLWAATVGRGIARTAAGLLILQLIIKLMAWFFLPHTGDRPLSAATEVLLAGFLLWAVFRYRTAWLMAAAGAQVMTVAIYAARAIAPQTGMWALISAADIFGVVLLAAVLTGAWSSRRRT